MLFAMPLLCKATSRAAREGEERFRRSLALLVWGKGEPPKVGEIPEGVAPCSVANFAVFSVIHRPGF